MHYRILLIISSFTLSVTTSVIAAEVIPSSGATIHQAKCVSCHDSKIYTRKDSKVDSFCNLSNTVAHCGKVAGVAETRSLVDYLNDQYYSFPAQECQ